MTAPPAEQCISSCCLCNGSR
uniref:Uncharacterized protein n=1 Tax=Anguilla anguilla TaxID=7936 RepID=A0A0E9SSU3_ANGAN